MFPMLDPAALDLAELQKLHALSGEEAKKCAADWIERLARQVNCMRPANTR